MRSAKSDSRFQGLHQAPLKKLPMLDSSHSPPPIAIAPQPNRRGVYRLQAELWLPQPLDVVFAFFADAFNLEEITPPWLRFEVLTPRPIEMQTGQLIDYRLRLRGIPIHWQSEIKDWSPPYEFVDEMRRGPYRLWRHRHRFTARDGGTEVIDEVDYSVPGGALVNRLFVQRDLTTIFEYRRDSMRKIFAGAAPRV